MLSLLSQDLTALEGHYHKSFYREYTQKVENLSTFSNESKSSSGSNLYKDAEFFCFFFFFFLLRRKKSAQIYIQLLTKNNIKG